MVQEKTGIESMNTVWWVGKMDRHPHCVNLHLRLPRGARSWKGQGQCWRGSPGILQRDGGKERASKSPWTWPGSVLPWVYLVTLRQGQGSAQGKGSSLHRTLPLSCLWASPGGSSLAQPPRQLEVEPRPLGRDPLHKVL